MTREADWHAPSGSWRLQFKKPFYYINFNPVTLVQAQKLNKIVALNLKLLTLNYQ